MLSLRSLLHRHDEDLDELAPSRRRIDTWAPVVLPLAMLAAKTAADILADRNTRLTDTLSAVQAQRDELRRQLDDLTGEQLLAGPAEPGAEPSQADANRAFGEWRDRYVDAGQVAGAGDDGAG